MNESTRNVLDDQVKPNPFLRIYEVIWSGDQTASDKQSDCDTVFQVYAANHLDAGIIACNHVPGGPDSAGYPRQICEMGISDVPSKLVKRGMLYRGPIVRETVNLQELRERRVWSRIEGVHGLGEECWTVAAYQ